jgi:glutamine synthetase
MKNDRTTEMPRADGGGSVGPNGDPHAAAGWPPVSGTNHDGTGCDAAVGGRVSRLVLEQRDRWSVEDVARFVTEQGIVAVALMHVAGDGNLRLLDFVPRSEQHLLDILSAGERSDASSLFPECDRDTGGSDLLLRPRVETAFLDPFAADLTLAVLCSHATGDGLPFPESPDTIVRAAARRVLEIAGVELWAHGEIEFFLGRLGLDEGGAREQDSGYQTVAPFVFGEATRRRAQRILTGMGVPVKYAHSEVGYIQAETPGDFTWEQHEVELALAPLPQAADAVVLTQWVVRRVASDAGLRCSFDPLVRAGHAGNGLHFHFSPVRDGSHLPCLREDGSIAEEAGWLVGGLILMAGGLMAFGNRTQRSFDRLTDGLEVPKAIGWGVSDRRALVRVPIQPATEGGRRTSAPTVEFRLPDGSAQTHLLLAAAAAAMLAGMRTEGLLEILGATRSDGSDSGRFRIPVTPAGVAGALEACRAELVTDGIFPGGFIDRIAAGLRG